MERNTPRPVDIICFQVIILFVCNCYSCTCTVFPLETINYHFQMFSYPSISPVSMNALSGVISPTTLSLLTSPVATPRTTPRSTPIPRWTNPFISLDENMDYGMLSNFYGVSSEEHLLSEGTMLLIIC